MNRMQPALIAIVAFLATSGAVIGRAKTQSSGTPHVADTPLSSTTTVPKRAEEQFKNIQVLKGIPAEQLIPTMQFISASLGVECDFCHVRGAFEKDDKKPKQTARKMMDMMFAINKDNFEGHREVTCYSCHRGSANPQAIPAVMTEEAEVSHSATTIQPQQAQQNAGPTAEQLLDRYVQVLGGVAAIEQVKSRVMKGTIEFGGKSLPIDIYAKAPNQRISYTHMTEGDSITAFNGHEGWLGLPGHPVRGMQGSELDAAAMDADLQLATHLKSMFLNAQVRGTERIADHDTYVVVGRAENKPPVRLYFDEQSGLLVRLVRFGDTAVGWLPTQIDYADYREMNGLKVPYRWTLARPNGRFTIQVNEMQQNIPVDDARFVEPAAEPQKASTK